MNKMRVNVQGSDLLMGLAVGVGLWLVYQAAKKAAQLAKDGAAAVDDAAASAVSTMGAVFGLPTTQQTIHDPYVVRWIMDHVSYLAASQWGTAAALYQATFTLSAGDGDATPPDAATLQALGVNQAPPLAMAQQAAADYLTSGATGNESFAQVASGQVDYFNPLRGLK